MARVPFKRAGKPEEIADAIAFLASDKAAFITGQIIDVNGGITRVMKTVKIPTSEHPITIERNSSRVRVTVAGRVVADTTRALTLRESGYPPVLYVPRDDMDMSSGAK